MKKELAELDIDRIVVKSRLRRESGDLSTLENSIRKLGLLHPVLVDRNHVLISGGRRLEACRHAGLSKVPALRLDIDNRDMAALDIQTDENLCRLPLATEDLEKHIQAKKAIMAAGESEKPAPGILSGVRKLLGRA